MRPAMKSRDFLSFEYAVLSHVRRIIGTRDRDASLLSVMPFVRWRKRLAGKKFRTAVASSDRS